MSDIFREVEEDVRREKLEKFWKSYGDYVIAGAAVLILGIGAFELWQRYETSQREKTSAAYTAASQTTDPAAAAKAFAELSAGNKNGYGLISKLQEANAMLAQGKAADAAALYRAVGDSDNGPLGAVARLRAGWILSETAPRAELEKLLSPLQGKDSAWRQMADEILAYTDYRLGNAAIASSEFQALADDALAPDMLRDRARAFAAFLKGGGAIAVGTVPPPMKVAAPGDATPPAPAAPAEPAAPPVPRSGTP